MNWQPGLSLEDMEREIILVALRFYHCNKTKTAEALKVSVRTIQNKLVQYVEQGHLTQDFMDKLKEDVRQQVEDEKILDREKERQDRIKEEEFAKKRNLVLRDRREYK